MQNHKIDIQPITTKFQDLNEPSLKTLQDDLAKHSDERLEAELKDLLEAEDYTDIKQAQAKIKKLQDKRKKFIEKNRTESDPAKECEKKILRVEKILELNDRILKRKESNLNLTYTAMGVSPAVSNQSVLDKTNTSINLSNPNNQMPACAERTLICLYDYFQKFKIDSNQVSITRESKEKFELLKKQLTDEQLDSPSVNQALEILEKALTVTDIKTCLEGFSKVLCEVRSIDIERLIQYIEKTHEAALKIKDKKIILLLGSTGSGKSTTIHFLAGSKMEHTKVNGLRHIQPIKPLPELSEITTTPFTRSETRNIKAVPIVYQNLESKTQEEVILCDSPGFDDTEGVEMDIANGIGIVKAVRECQSVKPVILISRQSIGDRWEGITKLAQTLGMFIPNLSEHLKTFFYLYTKFSTDEQDEIQHKLEDKLKHEKNGKGDDAAHVLINDLLVKTKSSQGAKPLNPLNDKYSDFLADFFRSPAIEKPEEVFRNFATPESLEKLKVQLAKHQQSIKIALDKNNIKLLNYKLGQLLSIHQHLNMGTSQDFYQVSKKEVRQFIELKLKEVSENLDFCFKDENQNIELKLNSAVEWLAKLTSFELIRKHHYLQDLSNLEDICKTRLITIQDKLFGYIETSLSKNDYNELLAQQLKKMHALVKTCKDIFTKNKAEDETETRVFTEIVETLEKPYRNSLELIIKNIKELLSEARKFIHANNFSGLKKSLDFVTFAINFLIDEQFDDCHKQSIKEEYELVKKEFLNHLKEMAHDFKSEILKKIVDAKLNDKDFQKIKINIHQLNTVKEIEGIDKHISKEAIDEIYQDLQQFIHFLFEDVTQKIPALLIEKTTEAYLTIKNTLEVLKEICLIPHFVNYNVQLYQIKDKIESFLNKEKENALSIMPTLSTSTDIDTKVIKQLEEIIRCLKAAECLSDLTGNLLEPISQKIIDYIENVQKQIQNFVFVFDSDFTSCTKLANIHYSITHLNALLVCSDVIPEIEKLIKVIISNYEDRIIKTLKETQPFFSLSSTEALTTDTKMEVEQTSDVQQKDIDISSITYKHAIAIRFVNICGTMNFSSIKTEAEALQKQLLQFTDEFKERTKRLLDQSFNSIINLDSEMIQHAIRMDKCFKILKTMLDVYGDSPPRLEPRDIEDTANVKVEQTNEYLLFEKLFKIFPTEISQAWYQGKEGKLVKYISFLSQTLEDSKDSEKLYKGLNIANALASLDNYLEGEKNKYSHVAIQYENKIRKLQDDAVTDIRLGIKTYRFDGLHEQIKKFNILKHITSYPKIMEELAQALDELSNKVLMQSSDLKFERHDLHSISVVLEDLAKLYQAKQYIFEHLQETVKIKLTHDISETEDIIHGKIKQFMDSVPHFIIENKFFEVEEALDYANGILALLDKHFREKQKLTEITSEQSRDKKQKIEPSSNKESQPDIKLSDSFKKQLSEQIQLYQIEIEKQLDNLIQKYSRPCGYLVMNQIPQKDMLKKLNISTDAIYVRVKPDASQTSITQVASYPSLYIQQPESIQNLKLTLSSQETPQFYYIDSKMGMFTPLALDAKKLDALDKTIQVTRKEGKLLSANELLHIHEATKHEHISLNIGLLTQHPPVDVLANLEKLSGSNPKRQKYEIMCKNLKNFFIAQIKLCLRQADKIELNDQLLLLAEIESIQKYLPPNLGGEFEKELKETRQQNDNRKKQQQRELEEVKQAGDFKKTIEILRGTASVYQWDSVCQIKQEIDLQIQQTGALFKADIENNNFELTFERLAKRWEEWALYAYSLKLINDFLFPSYSRIMFPDDVLEKTSREILKLLNEKFCDVLDSIKQLKKGSSTLSTIIKKKTHSSSTVSFLFHVLLSFDKLKQIQSQFYKAWIQHINQKLEAEAETAFKKMLNWFEANQKNFQEALINQNTTDLKTILDCLKETDSVFIELQNYITSLTGDSERKETLKQCKLYKEAKEEFTKTILKWEELTRTPLINSETKTPNAKDRDDFYKKIYHYFKIIKEIKLLSEHIDATLIDVKSIEQTIITHLKKQIDGVVGTIEGYIKQFLKQEDIYKDFNIYYDNLRSCSVHFEEPAISEYAKEGMRKIDLQLYVQIKEWENKTEKEKDLASIAESLIQLKTITIHIPVYKAKIDNAIDNVLDHLKKQEKGAETIGKLGLIFDKNTDKESAIMGQMLIAEHSAFQGYALFLRNEKMLKFSVDQVLDELKGDEIDKVKLKEEYHFFDHKYWELVKEGLAKSNQLTNYKQKLIRETQIISQKGTHTFAKIRLLMAYVFAYWTIENSQHYFDALRTNSEDLQSKEQTEEFQNKNEKDIHHYLMQPHAAQVISIFRLLGFEFAPQEEAVEGKIIEENKTGANLFGKVAAAATKVITTVGSVIGFSSTSEQNTTEETNLDASFDLSNENQVKQNRPLVISFEDYLSNHLVQIKTGEGKSVTLAITAIVLALVGYDVDCACYSNYLSQRDYNAFSSLFDAFSLNESIQYGTFNQLCDNYINAHGDIRGLVTSMIHSKSEECALFKISAKQMRPKILLIDEVDVFFNKDFYGNRYRPLANLADPSISALIDYIWYCRTNPQYLTFKNIKASEFYKACCSKFAGWEFLIEDSVKNMLTDIKNFESHQYVVINGKIGYKDQDGISDTITYGYQTLFAYYKEHEAGQISTSSLISKKFLVIDCGSFSYAEVPKQYLHIMGVTGTLETLSNPEKELLTSIYNICKFTYMPSVYGQNYLKFAGNSIDDVKLENSEEAYFVSIKNEIEVRLGQSRSPRAVMVFFESTPKLLQFYRHNIMASLAGRVKIMTEEVSSTDKESLVRQAATSGSITLLAKEFGRGTDFICYDDQLNSNGGVHVIQTFLSVERSEEIQIKGRTARQGNQGSYSMILYEKELEKFGISPELVSQMKSTNSIYDTLNEKRNAFFEKQYPEDMRYVEDIKTEHEQAQLFLKTLISSDIESAKRFLAIRNKASYLEENQRSRTICLMDATGSMTSLLQKSKHTVAVMFERAHEILREQGLEAIVEMQFAVYRNYNCSEDLLLQVSPWETKPESLRLFMDNIHTAGGLGNEAIEIGLWHANQEAAKSEGNKNLTQVILIGDMPPNTQNEVTTNRAHNQGGEAYWKKTKFAKPTFYRDELQILVEKKIPVHGFYVSYAAKSAFEEIAEITGGEANALDINSNKGAEMLTHLVTQRILNATGGKNMGQQLTKAYQQKYMKGYISHQQSVPMDTEDTSNVGLVSHTNKRKQENYNIIGNTNTSEVSSEFFNQANRKIKTSAEQKQEQEYEISSTNPKQK